MKRQGPTWRDLISRFVLRSTYHLFTMSPGGRAMNKKELRVKADRDWTSWKLYAP